jgi:hypothetical protein
MIGSGLPAAPETVAMYLMTMIDIGKPVKVVKAMRDAVETTEDRMDGLVDERRLRGLHLSLAASAQPLASPSQKAQTFTVTPAFWTKLAISAVLRDRS